MTEQHESGELQLAGMNVLEMNRGKSMRFIYLGAPNKVGDGWCFVCVLFFVLLFCLAGFLSCGEVKGDKDTGHFSDSEGAQEQAQDRGNTLIPESTILGMPSW